MMQPVRLPRTARKLEARDVKKGETVELPLPPKPVGLEWRDYLIMLLHIGAELEHGLMVQYLYAAYSLDDQTGSARQRKKVREWRDLLLTVAKEEMGHLLTVQNLLCLLGGPVCFKRSNFPMDTLYLPFPFRLEPVSANSVALYVYAEAPTDWQALLRTHTRNRHLRVDDDIKMVAELVGDQVVAGHAHTVGQLYDRILEVVSDPIRIPDSAFRADTYAHQASWDDWGRGYAPSPARPGDTKPPKVPITERSNILIMQMATRTEAIAALREIGGQGESAHLRVRESEEPSHFDRFLRLLDEFQWAGKDWNVVHRVPMNPTTIGPRDKPEGSTSIEQPTSLLWAILFNLRYRALLTYLSHTFRLARLVDTREPSVRGAVMHKIFGEMYNLKAIAGTLVRRPLRDTPASGRAVARRAGGNESDREVACAAPPFEMPYTIDVPVDEPDCWRRHQDILRSSLEIGHALLTGKDPHSEELTVEEINYLRTLQQLDQKSIAWMKIIIDGLLRTGGHGT
jgi:Ferritin-like